MQAWLFFIVSLVLAMVVVGGATRLTDSGLSITEWLPLLGAIPPLSQDDWNVAFEKYRQIPEYKLVNAGMSMAEFQYIYWWEWAHRFLGRFIGLAYAVPLAYFWARGMIRPGWGPSLLGLLALGGLQGFFGWYMVKSGLSDRVDVSHYRLALHLTTAFIILAWAMWLGLQLSPRRTDARVTTPLPSYHANVAWVIVALMLAQVVFGAFVAGLKAGLAHNTWPLMDGEVIPSDLMLLTPWHLNFVENVTTVQFIHRLTAYVLVGLVAWQAFDIWRKSRDRRVLQSAAVVTIAVLLQAALGVWTLLAAGYEAQIPIGLGLVHQGGAAVLLAILVWHLHRVYHGLPVAAAP
ncbi:MAG: COX15/CtaA family protein [Pseudomonadota bacterium]